MEKMLIADDNIQITKILGEFAKKEGYEVLVARDGEEALALFHSENPDIVLLDVMMPKLDGFQVCREIRRLSRVPILMITARGEDFEKIMGLDIGADDYIVKPFSSGEVMARVRAVLRRLDPGDTETKEIITRHNLTIHLEDFSATLEGEELPLTRKEMEILWVMAAHPGKVFTRENLLNSIWGYDYYGDNRTVDSHMKRLRAKLDVYPHPKWQIRTIWGKGYKFEEIE